MLPGESAPLNVMLVGTSLTSLLLDNSGTQLAAWGAAQSRPLTFIGPVTSTTGVHHNGRSGWSTQDHYDPEFQGDGGAEPTAAQQLPALLTTGGYAPDIVVLELGTNDGLNSLAYLSSYSDRSRTIAELVLTHRPSAVVVLATMLPNGEPGYEDKRDDFTATLSTLVTTMQGEGKRVQLLDQYTPLAPFNGSQYTDFTHPTDPTYDSVIEPLYRTALTAAIAAAP